METYIYKNITELKTPVGYFYVSDGKENIPFSIRKNTFDVPYHIYNDDNHIIGELNTETNYDLVLDVNILKTDCYYHVAFSNGMFYFGGSDEHTESIVATVDKWSIGIGSYNPNDDEELEQAIFYTGKEKGCIQYPPTFDETKFVRYIVSSASESTGGFEFKLLDYSYPEIVFKVAWIENNKYDKETYEDALDFWLT
ncbi:MAG: hypothetical protein E7394_09290 [Ruminococcaceae bacterium]|nr:hypothetical protein [Oscillospiraceae bacterium]